MRTFLLSVAMCAALAGCKKDNKPAAGESTGSAAATAAGSAAASATAAAGNAMTAAGSAMQAAGSAIEAAGQAAEAAGSAAQAAAVTAEAGAKAAEVAGAMANAAAGANVPRPASVTDAQIAIADKVVVTMTKLGDELRAAGKDCMKAAAAIKTAAAELEPMKTQMDAWEKTSKNDPALKAWFEANYMSKMIPTVQPLMELGMTCNKDKNFMAAMQSMKFGAK